MPQNIPLPQTSSVFVAIVGRPNVGKSSLMNRLCGVKTAIVTPKPQTTRTRITGIVTKGALQYIFLDTPGFHKARTALGQQMLGTVRTSLSDADVVLMLFEPEGALREEETELLASIKQGGTPAIGAVNKADLLDSLPKLEMRLQLARESGAFKKVLGISAETGENCEELLGALAQYAQAGPHYFPEDAYTDMPEKVLVAEMLREKLLLNMQEEIPHGIFVEIERFHEREDSPIIDIDAVIYCEKQSHKGMVIGKGGQMLKKVASAARANAEEMLGAKVNLKCWVKVRSDWRDDVNFLKQAGFRE